MSEDTAFLRCNEELNVPPINATPKDNKPEELNKPCLNPEENGNEATFAKNEPDEQVEAKSENDELLQVSEIHSPELKPYLYQEILFEPFQKAQKKLCVKVDRATQTNDGLVPHKAVFAPLKRQYIARKGNFGLPKDRLTCSSILLEQTPTQYRHSVQHSKFMEAL